MARIDTLGNFLTDVASAIKEKKGDSTNIAAEDFDTEIENLPSGGDYNAKLDVNKFIINNSGTFTNMVTKINTSSFNTSNLTNMSNMFQSCKNLTELDLSSFNTSNVSNMSNMFGGCQNLTELDLSNFNTSNVSNMSSMFIGCQNLTELDLSNFNTSNLTNMSSMFTNCQNLTKLNLSSFNTSNVTNMYGMFTTCRKLKTINFGNNFNASRVTNMSSMFNSCTELDNNTLNAILHICTTATSLSSSNKTLKYISLTSAQATTCEGLSNYQEFIDAGWTTGY